MIRLRQLILLAPILIWSCQDSDNPSPGDTFLKYYGEAGLQSGDGLVTLEASGETILYGNRMAADENQLDLFLLKVDRNGNEVISETYDMTDTASYGAVPLFNDISGSLRLSGSRLYYIGTSQNVEFSVLVWAIFDLDFNLEQRGWVSVCRNGETGDCQTPGNLTGRDLVIDEDELILVGTSDVIKPGDPLVPNGVEEQQIYLAKVNPSNPDSVLVERTRGFEGTDDVIYADRFSEDNIVIIGTTNSGGATQGSDVLVMALNDILVPRGSEIINLAIGNEADYDDVPFDVFKRNNGYVITGTSTRGPSFHPFFINISYNGSGAITVDQQDTLGVSDSQSNNGAGLAITLSPSGNYFIVGSMPTSTKGGEIMILQANQAGDHIPGLQRGYGLSFGNDLGNDVTVSDDGSLLILSTVDFGSGNTLWA